MVGRMNSARVSPSHRRYLARMHNEDASARCVEAEDAVRSVEGRREAAIICATPHWFTREAKEQWIGSRLAGTAW